MMSQEQTQVSLRNRINEYLRANPMVYAVEEPNEDALDAILSLLRRAEKDLEAAQERVDRLKWALEKARSSAALEVNRPHS